MSPHVLRHSCAMHTLEATHDIRKVALWLGHATVQTTEIERQRDSTIHESFATHVRAKDVPARRRPVPYRAGASRRHPA